MQVGESSNSLSCTSIGAENVLWNNCLMFFFVLFFPSNERTINLHGDLEDGRSCNLGCRIFPSTIKLARTDIWFRAPFIYVLECSFHLELPDKPYLV
uniref:Histidine biosynthesis bifunctional protein hisIE n=1 Tax=Arundo donax TaxID=35708 RepID=A0A0A9B6L1_ARUDO